MLSPFKGMEHICNGCYNDMHASRTTVTVALLNKAEQQAVETDSYGATGPQTQHTAMLSFCPAHQHTHQHVAGKDLLLATSKMSS